MTSRRSKFHVKKIEAREWDKKKKLGKVRNIFLNEKGNYGIGIRTFLDGKRKKKKEKKWKKEEEVSSSAKVRKARVDASRRTSTLFFSVVVNTTWSESDAFGSLFHVFPSAHENPRRRFSRWPRDHVRRRKHRSRRFLSFVKKDSKMWTTGNEFLFTRRTNCPRLLYILTTVLMD